jgi:hypothetical protein
LLSSLYGQAVEQAGAQSSADFQLDAHTAAA